jgi:membrane associated rhomboid family serine protease
MKYLFILLFITVHLFFGALPGYSVGSPLWTHFTYMFRHAGITHLAVNSFVFVSLFHLMSRYIDSRLLAVTITGCSFLASFGAVYEVPTVGASAMTYAMCGMYLYRLSTDMQVLRRNLSFVAATLASFVISYFREGSNFVLHLTALCLGYAVYRIIDIKRKRHD